jgi:hypothetical protein
VATAWASGFPHVLLLRIRCPIRGARSARFFRGLPIPDLARTFSVSPRTTLRLVTFARKWLQVRLRAAAGTKPLRERNPWLLSGRNVALPCTNNLAGSSPVRTTMGQRSIFLNALDREEDAARAVYLDEACAGGPERPRCPRLIRDPSS